MAENRQHPRRTIQLPVAFRVAGGGIVEAWCTDISLGGMFVETETPAAYGAQVIVHIALPGLKEDAELASTVRWVKKGSGMGVQFGVMGARETHALIELIHHAAEKVTG